MKKNYLLIITIFSILCLYACSSKNNTNTSDIISSSNQTTTASAEQTFNQETEKKTEETTEATTQKSTQNSTENPTQEATEKVTQGSSSQMQTTQKTTQSTTTAPTQTTTQKATQSTTTVPTQPTTQKPTQSATTAPTQSPTQKPTEAPTESKKNQLSTQGYDEAGAFGANTYIVKQNGLWGVVDFDGNVKIPITYTSEKAVGNGEYEFTKDGVGYVYNINTCKLLFSYNKNEKITNPEEYESKEKGTKKLFLCGEYIHKEYNKGMMLELANYNLSSDRYVDSLYYFTFKRGNTDEIIFSGYTKTYNPIADGGEWDGIAFSNVTEDNTAVVLHIDPLEDEGYISIVSNSGVKASSSAGTGYYVHNYSYSYGRLRLYFYADFTLINAYTGKSIDVLINPNMFYHGRGEYYAISIRDSELYDIYKDATLISSGWATVNFLSDKYIIVSNTDGDIVFMDYDGNIKATFKMNSSIFFNGKALVSDGVGYYYIDENLNKITDYIYKGTGFASTNAIKIGDKYYLISQ